MRLLYLFILFHWLPMISMADSQADTVYVKLDTNTIVIGQQTTLQLTYSGAKRPVSFPVLPDTFSKMEVITRGDIDTVSIDASSLTLRQSYMVTSFDSGFHVILPFQFKITNTGPNDSLNMATAPLLMQVKSVDVDTTQTFRDIKDIEEVPFSWKELLPWIAGVILVIVIIYLLWKKFSKKPKASPIVQEISIPPHEKALEALLALERKSLWQQGNHRQYHTELTDILRTFISERWNISAMEMTTDEILALSFIPRTTDTDGISYVLKTADLVKFAKSIPVSEEHQRCMHISRNFFLEHKPITNEEPIKSEMHGQ